MMSRSLFLYWCAFLWCSTSFAADHPSYLENIASGDGKQEKQIAAVFNKVAFGGVVTTKRSISLKFQAAPDGSVPPITTTSTSAPVTVSEETPPKPQERVEKSRTRQDLTATNTRNQQAEFTTNIPPFLAPKTSFPVAYTTPSIRADVPSYVPPVRTFFTPPLPPEYANPFADKPTLRGSNADPGSVPPTANRRPVPPPPRPNDRERIPLRPPDLPETNAGPASTSDRKKPLNTPSFHRPPGGSEYDNSDPPSSSKPAQNNETDFDFVPILHYPSVSRILSGSNGRKDFPDIRKPHVESRLPPKSLLPPPPPPAVVRPLGLPPVSPSPATESTSTSEAATIPDTLDIESKLASPEPPHVPPSSDTSINLSVTNHNLDLKPSRKNPDSSWLLAWDIHVYLIATLFLLLAVLSLFNLVRINSYKRLLSHGYYIAVHSILLVIGTLRCFYLFLDAYNSKSVLPKPFSDLVLHIVSPLITSVFLVLFLFILRASKVDVLTSKIQRPLFVAIFIICHVFVCVGFELSAELRPELLVLPLIGQCVYVVVLVVLGVTYLYLYKALSGSVQRKTENIFGSAAHKPSVAATVRTMLAAALTALLMAALQLYGIFSGLDKQARRELQWIWWGYQFSVRFVEVALCFLMLWAGVQSQHSSSDDEKNSDNSGFALFRCGRCSSEGDPADDIYPAVCVTNQAIHDYTLRTGKKVYDDTFPLGSLHRGGSLMGTMQREAAERAAPLYEEPDRRSLRKSQENYAATRTLARYDDADSAGYQRAAMFNYEDSNFSTNERRPNPRRPPQQPGASMLVAENGFVRFRALQEPEEHDSDDGLMER